MFKKKGFGVPTGTPKPCKLYEKQSGIQNYTRSSKPSSPQSSVIPSIADDTTAFSMKEGLVLQLETPTPVSCTNNKAASKTKP
jgi:hypothetical protein